MFVCFLPANSLSSSSSCYSWLAFSSPIFGISTYDLCMHKEIYVIIWLIQRFRPKNICTQLLIPNDDGDDFSTGIIIQQYFQQLQLKTVWCIACELEFNIFVNDKKIYKRKFSHLGWEKEQRRRCFIVEVTSEKLFFHLTLWFQKCYFFAILSSLHQIWKSCKTMDLCTINRLF